MARARPLGRRRVHVRLQGEKGGRAGLLLPVRIETAKKHSLVAAPFVNRAGRSGAGPEKSRASGPAALCGDIAPS